MNKQNKKKSKIVKKILMGFLLILIAAIIVLGFLWNKYLNKNSLLDKFESSQNQEVYLLGAFHENHFNKWLNYSMEDLLSVVRNIQPDVVLIEAREQYYKEFGVVDGPIDMSVVYSYCMENNISVEMIDWWVVDNNYQDGTTNTKRDDMMFANIESKLNPIPPNSKVLIVCGAGHFYKQKNRFLEHGLEQKKIKNKAKLFKNQDASFQYPDSVEVVWEQRAYFYAYTFPNIVAQDSTLNEDIKSQFTEGNHDAFYKQQLEYLDLFSNNKLYK